MKEEVYGLFLVLVDLWGRETCRKIGDSKII